MQKTLTRKPQESTTSNEEIVISPQHTNESLRGGYVLSLGYYDQVTCAAKRMATLQCWANHSDMSVVEPFVHTTYLEAHPKEPQVSSNVRFQNLFNITAWNARCREASFSELVSWESFIEKAPREVTLVQIIYRPMNESGCTYRHLAAFWQKWLMEHQFRLSHNVCIDFTQQDSLTLHEFNSLIFQQLPSTSTVIFNEWRGIPGGHESLYIPVQYPKCGNSDRFFEFLTPNHLILQTADRYIQQYLSTDYVGVMLRWEYPVRLSKHRGMHCLNATIQRLQSLQAKNRFNAAFLTVDLGKYGSTTFQKLLTRTGEYDKIYNDSMKLMHFMNYRKSISLAEYEKQFSDISGTDNPQHIALLQKTVAAKAKCLLLVGWGRFQHHALVMWKNWHPGGTCFKTIHNC